MISKRHTERTSNHAPLLPPPARDFNEARQQYIEQYGSALVTNRHLLVAILAVSLVAIGAFALTLRTVAAVHDLKPLVIRIDEVGRAEAVQYATMTYRPQASEIRYFLTRFVHDRYSRIRPTLSADFTNSLYFLEPKLAAALVDANRKTKAIENYIVTGGDDVEVSVTNIVLEDLRTPPFHAAVDFDKIYLSGSDRMELRRERYVANFEFRFRDNVPNDMIPVNPLGLTITYYREDQAFKETKP